MLRSGFTTGSCAAAAAKAAAYMLLFGTEKKNITILTPKGIEYSPDILDIKREESFVSCAVRKDAGDDPDVTNGALIYARVEVKEQDQSGTVTVEIDGGKGVGRVTKPGLDQPVGNAAINHVPREMITKEVTEVAKLADFSGTLSVVVSVPEGEEIAEKTFNPRLGITGGISIIGTSGVVEPMSTKAILDTIRVELNQRRALGYDYVAVAPGNYGKDYMLSAWGYELDRSVKCSNFIGDTIDMAAELGFKNMLLTGHIGKLVKLSGGIMNTHSREGDCRMELIAAAAAREGADNETLRSVLDCIVTEEAIKHLEKAGLKDKVMNRIMDRAMYYLQKRAAGRMEIECIMYSNEYGNLAQSKGVEEWLILLAQEQEHQTL